jgi:hypothetical protein
VLVKGVFMKKRAFIAVFAVTLLAASLFAERGDQPAQPQKKGPPTFVEEPIPAGKAIIYVYNNLPTGPRMEGWSNVLVLRESGMPTVLTGSTYCTFVTDPGTFQMVIVVGSGGQYGSGMLAKKFAFDAVGGKALFVGPVLMQGIREIPAEKALKDDGILYCSKVE